MKEIVFQSILDGVKRTAIVKRNVNGYKHTENLGIHIFKRGKIGFIIDTNSDNVSIRKFNYNTATYEDLYYEHFHKFIDIIVIGNVEDIEAKERKRKELDGQQIEPTNRKGLEDYHFLTLYGTIYVYHYIEYEKPLYGKTTKKWLCCTEGWHKRSDGKWYETVQCGWEKSRVADTIEDIFNYYRSK